MIVKQNQQNLMMIKSWNERRSKLYSPNSTIATVINIPIKTVKEYINLGQKIQIFNGNKDTEEDREKKS